MGGTNIRFMSVHTPQFTDTDSINKGILIIRPIKKRRDAHAHAHAHAYYHCTHEMYLTAPYAVASQGVPGTNTYINVPRICTNINQNIPRRHLATS